MNGTHDIHDITTDDDIGGLGPREAVRLLEQTTRQAKRGFDFRTPALSLIGATVVLLAFGALWLSVRRQHPYTGPTAEALVFMYGVLAAWITLVATVRGRASAGVSGRSKRQERAYGVMLVAALVAVSVFEGVLKADGVRLSITYGIYPPTAQLTVLGTIGAAIAAGREDWPGFGVAIAIILIATGSAFAGPVGVWLSDGIGCCVVVLAHSAAQAWVRNR